MSRTYNRIERAIAYNMSRFPFLKSFLKKIYARINYIVYRKGASFQSDRTPRILLGKNHRDYESFFGYYDKSPVSSTGFVLLHLTGYSTTKVPKADEPISIAVYDRVNDQFIFETSTYAYNWQQGARVQWLNNDLFIFNDFDKNHRSYISRVCSLTQNGDVKQFNLPVQDAFGAVYFLSINYQRLLTLRPDYGYHNLPPLTSEELREIKNDGIWKVEYEDGASCLLYTIQQVINTDQQQVFENAIHKVNHVMISPNGEHFIFLHRYFLSQQRFDRLMLAKSDGSGLKTLASYDMVSHCAWVDDTTIIGYLRGPGNRDGYWFIDIKTGNFTPLAGGILDKYGDGHPHVNGDWLVTDTYPDKARMQQLILCNWKTGEIRQEGEFFHGFKYKNEMRCDLHPRLTLSEQCIFFDSVFSGSRKLYSMDVDL